MEMVFQMVRILIIQNHRMEQVSRIRMVTAIKGMVKCGDQKTEQVTVVVGPKDGTGYGSSSGNGSGTGTGSGGNQRGGRGK